MAESVKFKDGRYLDANDVYDFEKRETQAKINLMLRSELKKNIGAPFLTHTGPTTYTMPFTCMCLVLQYGTNNLSEVGTLTLDGADILTKTVATLQYGTQGYCRIIPIEASEGSVFKITADSATIIF